MPSTFLPSDALQRQYIDLVTEQAKIRTSWLAEKLNSFSALCYTQADIQMSVVQSAYDSDPAGQQEATRVLNELYNIDKRQNEKIHNERRRRIRTPTMNDILKQHVTPDSPPPSQNNSRNSSREPSRSRGNSQRSRSTSPQRLNYRGRREQPSAALGRPPRDNRNFARSSRCSPGRRALTAVEEETLNQFRQIYNSNKRC